jgi:hypothetical protein
MCTAATDRATAACPGVPASCAARGTHGHAGRSAAARERRAQSASAWFRPVPACTSALASPFQAPGLTICSSKLSRFRLQITAGYTYDKRSAHLWLARHGMLTISGFLLFTGCGIASVQLTARLRSSSGTGIPSISPVCAHDRGRFTQVIHRSVHTISPGHWPASRHQFAAILPGPVRREPAEVFRLIRGGAGTA